MADVKNPVSSPHDVETRDPETQQAELTDLPHGIDVEQYRATVPRWKRIWHHSLTQMILLSIQAFCGPAMSDAITGESVTKFNTARPS
jgi:hypothetical protein